MKLCMFCSISFLANDWFCPSCGKAPQKQRNYYSFVVDATTAVHDFPSEAFPKLAELENKHFWFEARNRLIIWLLKKYFSTAENFFEIGCGTGYVLSGIAKDFPDLKLSGSDFYCEGLDFAWQRLNNHTLFQMDARSIPFINEFAVIGAFDVLEHIDEDEIVLKQIHKALRNNGGLILTVPQHKFLWSQSDDYACHKRRYTRNELQNKLKNCGFRLKKTVSFMSLLLPFMLISRLRRQNEFDAMAELKINQYINYLFSKILWIEFKFIQAGITFPFGGSLVVVAEKL